MTGGEQAEQLVPDKVSDQMQRFEFISHDGLFADGHEWTVQC